MVMARASSSIFVHIVKRKHFCFTSISGVCCCDCFAFVLYPLTPRPPRQQHPSHRLRFGRNGEFKILQEADMHYADGRTTPCEDVLASQLQGCSDLNTTAFIHRMIESEKPDFIVFTGDNIYGFDSKNSVGCSVDEMTRIHECGIDLALVEGNTQTAVLPDFIDR